MLGVGELEGGKGQPRALPAGLLASIIIKVLLGSETDILVRTG
jgi:hypothetical protein